MKQVVNTPLGKSTIWADQLSAVTTAALASQQLGGLQTPAGKLFGIIAHTVGVPYDYADSDPMKGFDCSALTWYVRSQLMVQLGLLPQTRAPMQRGSTWQAQMSGYPRVSQEAMQVGDICCYDADHDGECRHVNIIIMSEKTPDGEWLFALNASGRGEATQGGDPDSYVKLKCVRAPISMGGVDGPGVYWRSAYVYTVRPQ